MHLPCSQDVQMQMIHGLSTIGAGVDDDAESVFEMLLLCNVVHCEQEFA